MKGNILILIFGILFAISLVSIGFCQDMPIKATGVVTDLANVLSDSEKVDLTNKLNNLKQTTGLVLYVLTIDSFGDFSKNDYMNQLSDKWGLNNKFPQNGLILVVSKKDGYSFVSGKELNKYLLISEDLLTSLEKELIIKSEDNINSFETINLSILTLRDYIFKTGIQKINEKKIKEKKNTFYIVAILVVSVLSLLNILFGTLAGGIFGIIFYVVFPIDPPNIFLLITMGLLGGFLLSLLIRLITPDEFINMCTYIPWESDYFCSNGGLGDYIPDCFDD